MAVIELTRETFSSEVLAEKRMVVVDFWASYCMPCRMLIPVMEKASTARSDVKFCKINVDDAQDVAERYGVMSMPILIFFKNGEPVDESIGLITKDELLAILEKNK